MKKIGILGLFLLPCLLFGSSEGSGINSSDVAFMVFCASLVLLMTPALAMFYAGMVRSKNVLSTLMNCFVVIGILSIQWVLLGYSIAFGGDIGGGFLGNFDYLGLSGVGDRKSVV